MSSTMIVAGSFVGNAVDDSLPEAAVPTQDIQSPASGTPGVTVPPNILPILMQNNPALAVKPTAPPPHPQISQPLTAIPLGYQMAFNQLTSPTPYNNVITAYKIYRNKTSNNFSGSNLIRTIVHDPTHQGAVTVQDSTGGNVNYFYFVTAVDSTGQESNQPGSFQGTSVTSGAANPNVMGAVSTSTAAITTTPTVISGLSITLTTHGRPVLVAGMAIVQWNATGSISLILFKDGAALATNILGIGAGAAGDIQTLPITFIDTPTAASHTYDLRVSEGSSFSAGLGGLSTIQVIELG